MPPKRAKKVTQNDEEFIEEMEEEEDEKRKRGKARVKAHEAFVLAIDVGRTSAEKMVPDEQQTDLERSLKIADWVISRKIFTESSDRFSLMFFGHESTSHPDRPNVYFHNEEFNTARTEWLQVLQNEVQTNSKSISDYIDALYASLDALKVHIEGQTSVKTVISSTITLMSNLSGMDDEQLVTDHIEPLAQCFKSLRAELLIVGPELEEEPRSKSQRIGYSFAKKLSKVMSVNVYNFRESLSQLKLFIPKYVQPRGQPFNLELGRNFAIRVQMYVKNDDKSPLQLKFNPVGNTTVAGGGQNDAEQGNQELKKVRRYETISDSAGVIKYGQIDQASDAVFATMGQVAPIVPTGRFIGKEQLTKCYLFGTTLVPFDAEVAKMLEYPREGKQLQLLQFIHRKNILPQFIMNNCRYILPAQNDHNATTAISALCQAMLELGVIALCRYAYNINSNPKMAILIPKISKETNYPVLIHYLMPFRDDFRYFDFPAIRAPLKNYQLDLMDSYINELMLYDEERKVEKMKKSQVHDPRMQYECQLLRDKALNPNKKGMELSADDLQKILETLAPAKGQVQAALNVVEEMREEFPLELNEQTKMAAFRKDKERTGTLGRVDDRLRPVINEAIEAEMKAKKEEV